MKKVNFLTHPAIKLIVLFIGMTISIQSHSQETVSPKTALNLKGIKIMRPAFEDISIYRIQLRVTTGRGSDAGTDEGVYVQLNNADQKFFLSKGIDNFQEGHADTYDVLSEAVRKIKDISFLRFGVKGDDGWCLKKVELFLNDNDYPVFMKEYAGRGQCADNKSSFTIPAAELRSHPGWNYNGNHSAIWKAPNVISKEMIKSLVECSIGNQLNHTPGFGWGTTTGINTRWGDVVEFNKVNDNSIHFDLDLQRYLNGPNPEVDIDFDLVFSCVNGRIVTEMINYQSGSNWVGAAQELFRKKIAELIGDAISSKAGPVAGKTATGMLSSFLSFGINIDINNPTTSSSCEIIKVDNAGNILLR